MNDIKKSLEDLFDDMIKNIQFFKKTSYHSVFKEKYEENRELFLSLSSFVDAAEESKKDRIIKELATVIPDYARGKLASLSKRQKEISAIDYNMNIVVYIIPMLLYDHHPVNEAIADQLVSIWNETKVTGMEVKKETFEGIEGGFKKGFCYITTAVCESQNKPDNCHELTVLREYRDQYLMMSEEGQRLVAEYYALAPSIVMALNRREDSAQIYDGIYQEYLIPCIRYAENGKNVECKKLYMDMVHHLQEKYLES